MKRAILLLFVPILMGLSACQPPAKPNKIARISSLLTHADGDQVEIGGWINSAEGDDEVGYELIMTDTPNSSPQAVITLKDGQTSPGQEKEGCVRAKIFRRVEVGGATTLWLKDAEVIECY
ncbi:MAG: hypothetical protein AB1489_04660 [Acidobacteriota bacterium]